MSKVIVFSADRTLRNGLPQNVGDALLTDSLCSAIEKSGHTAQAVDFSPFVRIHQMRGRTRVAGLFKLWRLMRGADAILVGGGTLLADDQPQSRTAGLPRFCLVLSLLSWLARRPLVFFAVGCDPIDRRFAQLLLRLATLGRSVVARDAQSVERCRLLWPASVTLAADAVLLPGRFRSGAHDEMSARDGAIVALNRKHVPYLNGQLIGDLKSTFGTVRFLAMDQGEAGDSDGLPFDIAEAFDDLLVDQTWQQAVDHVESASFVVASRMHALYIALMSGVPSIAVGDDAKVKSFADEFDVERISELKNYHLPPLEVSEAQRAARESAAGRVESALNRVLEGWK